MPAAVPSLVELLASRAQLDAAPAFWSLLARIDAARTSEPKVPRAFAKVLRPYQIEGFRWMSRLAAWGAGACLVDEMGLGKTVQALALLISRSKAGPALVVAPTSVGPNWIHEARRFAPSLKATLHRGAGRPSSLANVGPDDVIVTSYDVLARDADAGFFGAEADFRGRYVVPIERDKDASRSAALARVVRPFLLRCKKAEVATELPSRTELTRAVERSPAERKLYEAAREDLDESARLRGGDGQAR